MKRRLFFWVDQLHISRRERVAVKTLLLMLLLSSGIKPFVQPKTNYDPGEYERILADFRERSALLEEERQRTLARFRPDSSGRVGRKMASSEPAAAPPDSSQKIDINTATAKELQSLPGIGPAYAERIVEYRKEHGPFRNIQELTKVKGIGAGRLKKLKPYISTGTNNE
jgi:competence ComEA-like helix-hairpin-helix protein